MIKNFSAHIRPSFILFNLLCFFFLILFIKLGIWQIHRLGWKTNLIATVNQRINNSPIEAPKQNEWQYLKFSDIDYLPVKIYGDFLPNKTIYVTTVSNGQTGYWQMAVLRTPDNNFTFVNRGFVPMDLKNSITLRQINSQEAQGLTGILRLNEKTFGFLYKNNLKENRWYKRNIKDMAIKLNLPFNKVAPYFIDEAKQSNNLTTYPLGGLTVVSFPNSHLNYAITWFVMALGVLAAIIFININEFK